MPTVFYKYTTVATAKLILSNCCIRWSAPSAFNDPFDFAIPLTFPFEFDDVREPFSKKYEEVLYADAEPPFVAENPFTPNLRALRQEFRNLPRHRFQTEMGGLLSEAVSNFQRRLAEEAERWNRESEEFRLLCVSEQHDSILMWSHYSDDHCGVVLRFRAIEELGILGELGTPLCAAEPVRYSETIPFWATQEQWIDTACGLRAIDTPDFMTLALTKHIGWAYEKEWRVITERRPDEPPRFADTEFYPEEIDAIYFGCRIDQKDRAALLSMLCGRWSHMCAYDAVPVPKAFALKFRKVK